MGLFDTFLNAITDLVCGTPSEQQQQQPVSQQPPPSSHISHQQQQHQYPPAPQQQNGHVQGQHGAQHQGYTKPHSQSPPPKQHHAERPSKQDDQHPKPAHHRSDLNQINQHDSHYTSLRSRASQEGDQMARCFEESHEAYSRGDGARAKELSNQGKEHKRKMEELNSQASEWIFAKNNEDSGPGEIDLHGLYVKEAITYTDRAVEAAKRRGDSHVNLIVGKGLHSAGGIAKLRPAIEELMQKHQLLAELDPDNVGVLTVQLNGQSSGRGPVMGPDEVSRRLEHNSEGCVIM